MGKSPGRWIKTVLFGKKSSKSHSAKGKERTANEKQVLVAANALEDDAISAPVISHPIPVPTVRSERHLQVESQEAADVLHNGGVSLPDTQDAKFQGSGTQVVLSDDERRKQEEAATLAQAAFRGYLARRAFRALKGIIRLQALIRGHLVRRQAVATLSCVLGVVKLQALARGIKMRNSGIGQEVQRKRSAVQPLDGKLGDSNGVNVSSLMARVPENAFIYKLMASSPIVMPLCLYYDAEEPNSVPSWLERWSASCFWKPIPQPKKIPCTRTQRKQGNGQVSETEIGRSKRTVRRVPEANIDNIAVQSTSEFEKPKRNLRKVPSHPAEAVQENPQSELEKVKRNLRRVHNPVLESSVQSEAETEKPKQTLEKVSGTYSENHWEHTMNNMGEKTKKETTLATPQQLDVVTNEPTLTVSKMPDAETSLEPLRINEASETDGDQVEAESKPLVESGGKHVNACFTNGVLNHKEDPTSNENHISNRKASTVVKQERAENGLQSGSPALPSYMAATESAKAKLRAQGSPRFSQDGVEKNNLARRHSLPSPVSSKISSQSPRTRTVHSGGKAGSKSDRSMASSKEGNAKASQVEWRR